MWRFKDAEDHLSQSGPEGSQKVCCCSCTVNKRTYVAYRLTVQLRPPNGIIQLKIGGFAPVTLGEHEQKHKFGNTFPKGPTPPPPWAQVWEESLALPVGLPRGGLGLAMLVTPILGVL